MNNILYILCLSLLIGYVVIGLLRINYLSKKYKRIFVRKIIKAKDVLETDNETILFEKAISDASIELSKELLKNDNLLTKTMILRKDKDPSSVSATNSPEDIIVELEVIIKPK